MKSNLGRSAAFLTVIGIISKVIGAMYRVPLTNTVGAEGMGLYQTVFPVYAALLSVCGGGIAGATTRVVAKYTSRGDDVSALRVVKAAILPLTAVSVLSAAVVMIFRNAIASVQGNPEVGLCYLAIAPSLLFTGVIGVLRGYFQGKSKVLPSGISQLAEQIVKLVVGLYLAKRLMPYGVVYAVVGALCGVTASEFVAFLYLLVRLIASRRKNAQQSGESGNADVNGTVGITELRRELFSFALPTTVGSVVLPLTQLIDSALVVNLLTAGGVGREQATALFGLFVGPVATLVNLPTVVTLSITVAILPALTSAVERGQNTDALIRKIVLWTTAFTIPVTTAFMLFPETFCTALYSGGLSSSELAVAARLLRVQAVSVPYAAVLHVSTAILQAGGEAKLPVINLAIGAVVKAALTPVAVKSLGIYGAGAATVACYGVAALLTSRRAFSTPTAPSVRNALVCPLVFSGLGSVAFFAIVKLTEETATATLISAVAAASAFAVVYAIGMIATGALGFDFKKLIDFFRRNRRKQKNEKLSK